MKTFMTKPQSLDLSMIFGGISRANDYRQPRKHWSVYVPEGLTQTGMVNNPYVQRHVADFALNVPSPGSYDLRMPVPETAGLTYDAAVKCLRQHERVASASLVTLALVAAHVEGIPDPLHGDFVRCVETDRWGRNYDVFWDNRKKLVRFDASWKGYRSPHLFLVAVSLSHRHATA